MDDRFPPGCLIKGDRRYFTGFGHNYFRLVLKFLSTPGHGYCYENVARWEKFACVLFRICFQEALVVGSQNILIDTAECECLIN